MVYGEEKKTLGRRADKSAVAKTGGLGDEICVCEQVFFLPN